MGHRFASARDQRRKRNYAKIAKTPPASDAVFLLVAEARLPNFMQIDVEPFPLVA
jgi:hypothetical protein